MFKYIFFIIVASVSYFIFFFDPVFTNELIGQLFVSGILGCL